MLAAGSSLSFDFSIKATSFLDYAPDFKINWEGTKNNYDLVSKPLAPEPGTPPTSVPEPSGLLLSAVSLLGLAFWAGRRKKTLLS